MALPILDACRKRKRPPKLFEFQKFAEPCNPIGPTGPFRDNIRVFLRDCAALEDQNIQGNPTWCTLLFHETKSFVVPLYTIEEDVKHSQEPFCDHCRCSGWSNNFVSKRKYHMIIPTDRQWNKPLEDDVFDLNTHLLHGLIHCNGFGHLLCINGIEGGSRYLCGREIMDLWDRICSNLRARKITVEDLSKKRSMDLRLLYGVSYGHSWFGRWGYKFCRGSFGVTQHNYDKAIEILSSLELDRIIEDFNNTTRCIEIRKIVRHYRDMSETQLTAINDLLRFMLTVKSCAPTQKFSTVSCSSSFSSEKNIVIHNKTQEKSVSYKKFSKVIAKLDSRWPARRLQSSAEVIVEALKENKADKYSVGGMSRQDVRNAARMHIGDTGLLDYVLKSMNNVIVGNYVIRRAVNPATRVLEYTIHELNNGVLVPGPQSVTEISSELLPNTSIVPGADVYSDIAFLYTNVLLNYPKSELIEIARRAILDSKRFVKEWPFRDEPEPIFTFSCQLLPSLLNSDAHLTRGLPPPEIVMVPLHATVFDLKQAVETAFRDTYYSLEKFVVREIEDLEEMVETESLFGAVESGGELYVRGSGLDSETRLRYEGGDDNWKVRCECGARDDDGEAMVACDICEVWQHTRCCGIEDAETVPPLFVCPGCCDSLIPTRARSCNEFDSCDDLLLTTEGNYGEDVQFFDNNAMGSVSVV